MRQTEEEDISCSFLSGGGDCLRYPSCSPFLQLLQAVRKPIPALVGSLVRSSFICGLELELGQTVTPRVCCPGGLSVATHVEPEDDLTDLHQHPGAAHLAAPEACGISLVHQRTEDLSGVAGLGQYPWLAILGNITGHFTNTNNNCLGVLIGPQVLISSSHLSQ